MATLKILALELSKAFVLYRQPMPEREEFELLVRAWADVLADVSDAEFREGMRRTQAVLRFFPRSCRRDAAGGRGPEADASREPRSLAGKCVDV